MLQTFERLESEVRGYVRSFPTVFTRGSGAALWDEAGKRFIDFFAGAGALNYGHNPPELKRALISYLEQDGVVHALDMATSAKRAFLERFEDTILRPRQLDYKVQFCGPTGTNAVEAALKLARKVTGRHNIVFFTNGFHGMTLGSLAVSRAKRRKAPRARGASVPLCHTTAMPYDGYFGPDVDTLQFFERFLEDTSSGLDKPAAIIVETVQAEGGVNVARLDWLKRLGALCRAHDILIIVDDIQVGIGRTGPFFSFASASLEPDMIVLSKSLSGFGMPMALVLLKPDLDRWAPGEHNGTFRGFNPGFVTAEKALALFWQDDRISRETERKGAVVRARLEELAVRHAVSAGVVRGRGLIQGVALAVGSGLRHLESCI